MSLRDELLTARARRAHLLDRYSTHDPDAECMACRARGWLAMALLGALLGWVIAGPHRTDARRPTV